MKILVLLSRVPWPLEKGDKLRAFHLIREWSKENDVSLFCLTDQKIDAKAESKLNEICSEVFIYRFNKAEIVLRLMLSFFKKTPFQVNYFYSKKAQKAFDHFIDKNIPDHIFCQLVRTTEYVKKYSVIPKSVDYMDAFSTGMMRMAERSSWPMSAFMEIESKRLKNYEDSVQGLFQKRFIISKQDRDQMSFIDDLQIVSNGIDPVFLQHLGPSDAKKYDILFTGNMSYRPNVESAKFLVNDIMPLVWLNHPSAVVCLAGANPSNQVLNLKSERVIVTGWVDDISKIYCQSRVFVAPMLVNTGLQNKLLEAMACEVPCVTTSLANNALRAQPELEVAIANDKDGFAKAIAKILDDDEFRRKLASGGKSYVKENFSWEKSASEFLNAFKAIQ